MGIQIHTIDPNGKTQLAVEYRLEQGMAVGIWKQEGWPGMKEYLEEVGVLTTNGTFHPNDGQAFLDALVIAFSKTTYIDVRKT